MASDRTYSIGIVGARGYVGSELIGLIAQKVHGLCKFGQCRGTNVWALCKAEEDNGDFTLVIIQRPELPAGVRDGHVGAKACTGNIRTSEFKGFVRTGRDKRGKKYDEEKGADTGKALNHVDVTRSNHCGPVIQQQGAVQQGQIKNGIAKQLAR